MTHSPYRLTRRSFLPPARLGARSIAQAGTTATVPPTNIRRRRARRRIGRSVTGRARSRSRLHRGMGGGQVVAARGLVDHLEKPASPPADVVRHDLARERMHTLAPLLRLHQHGLLEMPADGL